MFKKKEKQDRRKKIIGAIIAISTCCIILFSILYVNTLPPEDWPPPVGVVLFLTYIDKSKDIGIFIFHVVGTPENISVVRCDAMNDSHKFSSLPYKVVYRDPNATTIRSYDLFILYNISRYAGYFLFVFLNGTLQYWYHEKDYHSPVELAHMLDGPIPASYPPDETLCKKETYSRAKPST
ncbi:MAG: hypothetical protein QW620_08415 [Thermoplasmata archaeon]